MARRAPRQGEFDDLPPEPAVGSAVPSGAVKRRPDDSYRRTKAGFKPPKVSKGARGRNGSPRRKPGAHA